jgi:hypothetical protein
MRFCTDLAHCTFVVSEVAMLNHIQQATIPFTCGASIGLRYPRSLVQILLDLFVNTFTVLCSVTTPLFL